jgi:DNA gyrase/topoisomerase IV subunit B
LERKASLAQKISKIHPRLKFGMQADRETNLLSVAQDQFISAGSLIMSVKMVDRKFDLCQTKTRLILFYITLLTAKMKASQLDQVFHEQPKYLPLYTLLA